MGETVSTAEAIQVLELYNDLPPVAGEWSRSGVREDLFYRRAIKTNKTWHEPTAAKVMRYILKDGYVSNQWLAMIFTDRARDGWVELGLYDSEQEAMLAADAELVAVPWVLLNEQVERRGRFHALGDNGRGDEGVVKR